MKFKQENYKQFMKAILDNEEDVVEIYLNQGINPNYQDEIGNTPLILAAKTNNVKLIKVLISFGAQLELANLMYETPLMEAIDLAQINAAQYLLSIGANVHTKDYRNKSLLFRLLNNPDTECFKSLLEHNIEINPEDEIKILAMPMLKDVYFAIKEKKEFEKIIENSQLNNKKQKI